MKGCFQIEFSLFLEKLFCNYCCLYKLIDFSTWLLWIQNLITIFRKKILKKKKEVSALKI